MHTHVCVLSGTVLSFSLACHMYVCVLLVFFGSFQTNFFFSVVCCTYSRGGYYTLLHHFENFFFSRALSAYTRRVYKSRNTHKKKVTCDIYLCASNSFNVARQLSGKLHTHVPTTGTLFTHFLGKNQPEISQNS